ncbi:MAG: SulP family inorganic anion transporter, partial [Clostridia bacterium]
MLKSYSKMLKEEFANYSAKLFLKDVVSGITVAAVALPLALAFGVASGADAAAGLITAIFAGIICGILGGAKFQISGPTGAMTAVLVTLVAQFGMQGVFVASLIAGVIVLLMGICKLGKLIQFIPRPVVTGFTSGIAIIIFLGQIDNFFGTRSEGLNIFEKFASYGRLGFAPQWQAVLIAVIVIAFMFLFPKKWNAKVPASLLSIVLATVISYFCKFEIATIGEIPRTLVHSTRLDFSTFDFATIGQLISPAFTIAALGMIESLLCGTSALTMQKGAKFHPNQELVAQGVCNIFLPFVGGVPSTAAIARTSVAIKSGCATRVTGLVQAVALIIIMFALSPIMSKVP